MGSVSSWLKWFINQISWPTVITSVVIAIIPWVIRFLGNYRDKLRKAKRIVEDLPEKVAQLYKDFHEHELKIASDANMNGQSQGGRHGYMVENLRVESESAKERLLRDTIRQIEDLRLLWPHRRKYINQIKGIQSELPPFQSSTLLKAKAPAP